MDQSRPPGQRDSAETPSTQRRAALTVEESEARLRALVEASPLGIDIMDLDGNPVLYNPKCEELHGIDFKEAANGGWQRALHPDDRARVTASWYEAARSGRSWSDTYRFLHQDGRVVWVIGRAEPMYVGGERIGFAGTLEDITVQKEAEQERERLLEREQAARQKAEAATRMRDETLAAVAHELRNPLQTMAVGVDSLLAMRPGGDDLAARQLEIMQRTVKKMDRLVGDLLDVSRMDAGTFDVRHEPVALPALVEEALEAFETAAADRGVGLTRDVARDVPPVDGDRERLVQVLSNLVENALKFTPSGGSVAVRARPLDHCARVSVEDTGPGVPPEIQPLIFDPFWKADRVSRVGSGLGLAIAKGIVEAHGGEIWMESNGGAKFHFTVPFAS